VPRAVKIVQLEQLPCPGCGGYLERAAGRHGLVWLCHACRGGAVTVPVLRHFASRDLVNRVWQAAQHRSRPSRQRCPACEQPFSELAWGRAGSRAPIRVCVRCYWVWLSAGLLATFALGPAPPPEIERPPASLEVPARGTGGRAR
jgi:hypothetical protein